MANHFPEILATVIFLPVGMFMGHMMSFVLTGRYATSVLAEVKFWPFIVGGVAAILTAGIHVTIKEKYKQYKFEHMYFQMVGLIIFITTAILVIDNHLKTASFLGFSAHGIIYVSALSYINIRTGKSKYRYFQMSLPHLFYLIGVALSTTLIFAENRISNTYRDSFYGITSGVLLLVTSIFCLILFLINELLQEYNRSFNYKQSLDNDINRENTHKEIFKHKHFHISPLNFNFPANVQLPYVPLNTKSSRLKEFGLILYAIASKILTLMFFYYPFLYLHTFATLYTSNYEVYLANWIAIVGLLISIIFMAFISYKINYLLSIVIKIIFMVVLLIFFSAELIDWFDMKTVFWFVFMGLNFGFSHPDINILSYTNLKSNELILAAGYFIEHLIIGVIQYETLFYPETIFGRYIDLNTILAHALTFIIILISIGIIGIFVIPNGKHNSLLEIKNILNKCAHYDHLNPQLNYQQQNDRNIVQNPSPQAQPMPYHPNNNSFQKPYQQNIFPYGQSNYPQQQYQQYPQQITYVNAIHPSQIDNAPAQFYNTNSNYPISGNNTTIPVVMMPPQQHNFGITHQNNSNIGHQIGNVPRFFNNTNSSPYYSQSGNNTTIPAVAMMPQQNFQSVPPNTVQNVNSYATAQIQNNPSIRGQDRFSVHT